MALMHIRWCVSFGSCATRTHLIVPTHKDYGNHYTPTLRNGHFL